MSRFDITTLLLATVVVSLLLALAVGYASLGRGLRVLRIWALSMLLHGIAYLLLALRGQVPDFLSIVGGNMVLAVSFSTALFAIAEFRSRRYPDWFYWVPVATVGATFTLLIDQPDLRLMAAGLIYGLQQIANLHATLVRHQEPSGRGHVLLATALLIVTVVVAARSVGIALGLIHIPSLTAQGATQAVTYLLSLIVPLLATMGFMFMVLEGADRHIVASKHQLDAIFDSIEESLALVHRDGRFLTINRTGAQRLGSQPQFLSGRPMADAIPADVNDRRLIILRRVLDSGRAEQLEDERLGRCMRITFYPVQGSRDTAVIYGIDVTETRAAEEALRNSEARYRALFENSHTVMLIINPDDGAIVDANAAAAHYYGWSQDRLRAMKVTDINALPPEEVKAEMARARIAARDHFLFRHRRADGSIRDVEIFSGPIRIDSRSLLYSIIHDVSDRQHGVRRTHALLDIGASAGRMQEREFLDRGIGHAETVTESPLGFFHFVSEDQRSLELAAWTDEHAEEGSAAVWAHCLREKRPVILNDYPEFARRQGLPDGQTSLRRLVSAPVIEDDKVMMLVSVANKAENYVEADVETVQLIGNAIWRIVRRDRAERAMTRALAEQKELNRKLEEAHNQLLQSEKMASIGQLAAGVAHEINNPIGFVTSNLGTLESYLQDIFAITSAYEQAERSAAGQLPELAAAGRLREEKDFDYLKSDITQLMTESQDGLARVRKIVQDLKDFSRVGDMSWQWADLHHGLESTLNVVWNELKYKCTVTKHYAPDLPQIRCLPSQLNQVFMNLLVNAAQAIEVKDGRMGEIRISTRRLDDDTVQIEIADNGKGIPADQLPRIFDPFFTTKPVGQGTGLGLSIAWGIVGKHQGKIDVKSSPGVGTTFTITLPVAPSAAP